MYPARNPIARKTVAVMTVSFFMGQGALFPPCNRVYRRPPRRSRNALKILTPQAGTLQSILVSSGPHFETDTFSGEFSDETQDFRAGRRVRARERREPRSGGALRCSDRTRRGREDARWRGVARRYLPAQSRGPFPGAAPADALQQSRVRLLPAGRSARLRGDCSGHAWAVQFRGRVVPVQKRIERWLRHGRVGRGTAVFGRQGRHVGRL